MPLSSILTRARIPRFKGLSVTIQHLAINCADRRAQERFYTRHFGFRRARVFNAGRPDEFVMLRWGPSCIELFGVEPAAVTPRPAPPAMGFVHLALEVQDLDARVAALQAEGVDIDPIVDCGHVVAGLRVCFLRDPEGNVLELMEGWHDEADPPPAE